MAAFSCFWAAGKARADVLMTSARQMQEGSLKLLVFHQGMEDQDLNFKIAGPGISSTAPAGGFFPSASSGNSPAQGDQNAIGIKVVYQPWENLQYYASATAGHFTLRTSSVTTVNTLSGDRLGFGYGFGVKAVVAPDSIVTPAFAVDLGLSRSRYFMSRLEGGGAGGGTNQRFDLFQYHVAIEASHQFKKFEPFGGVRWVRLTSHLKDLSDSSRVSGHKDVTTPFVGVRVPVFSKESLVAEASFINGLQIGVGVELKFK